MNLTVSGVYVIAPPELQSGVEDLAATEARELAAALLAAADQADAISHSE